MPLANRLADYALSLRFENFSPEVIHACRQRIIDTLGCALGAIDAPPIGAIRSYVTTLPPGPSSILFSRARAVPETAAFLNATMVRFLDFNDGYFALEPGHSSDNIPACMAVAQAEGRGGRDLLVAMVIAYEVQMRLQDAASLFRRGWDHVNYVTISATLAVGTLLGLSKRQMVDALGMALNGHVAMRQVRSGELSGWKGASAANATRNAVFCAYLARHGMTGPSAIFEGEMGFFAQVSGTFDLDVAAFGNGANKGFHIMRARTKPYATNGEMQTAVMAAVSLRDRLGSLDEIATIEIATTDVGYRFLAKDSAKWRPQTRETADHSLPYTVARALIDGTITRATYDSADFGDPHVLRIVDKISVLEDPELTEQMPSLANRVTITMADGRTFTEAAGTRDNPRIRLSDREIEGKFRDFGRQLYSGLQIASILELCWKIDEHPSLEPLFDALVLPREPGGERGK